MKRLTCSDQIYINILNINTLLLYLKFKIQSEGYMVHGMPFNVSKAVARYMTERRKGHIINITSLNAEAARPTIVNYSAAKGGLKLLTKSMATEWGNITY